MLNVRMIYKDYFMNTCLSTNLLFNCTSDWYDLQYGGHS